MRNPWWDVDEPSSNYVHQNDKPLWLSSTLPPQPYLENFKQGKIMWLLGGFGTGNDMVIDSPAHQEKVLAWTRQNLHQDLPALPNFWLAADDSESGFCNTRDVKWWRRATGALHRSLLQEGMAQQEAWQRIASGIFILEAFPYPSKTRPNRLLSTHCHTRHLLQQWIQTGKPIVLGRAERFWSELVPEFQRTIASGQALRVRNVQCAAISSGNLPRGEDELNQLVQAIST